MDSEDESGGRIEALNDLDDLYDDLDDDIDMDVNENLNVQGDQDFVTNDADLQDDDADLQDDVNEDMNDQIGIEIDTNNSSDEITSNENSDDMEEGEFVVPLDWDQIFKVPYGFAEDYVQPYVQDPGLVEREQREVERQEFLNERLYVPSSSFQNLSFKVFTKIEETPLELSWLIDETKDFDVNEFILPSRDDDHEYIFNRLVPGDGTCWNRDRIIPHLYWDFIMDVNARSYATVILSWFFDKEIQLFIIKRREGCQYLSPMKEHFHSLSESDLMELGRKWLVNVDNDGYVAFYAKKIHDDYVMKFKEEGYDKEKLFIKHRPRKKIVKEDGSIKYVQRKIKCHLKVPTKKWPQDILGKLDHWEIEKNTGEARMYEDKDKKIVVLRMCDPMQLINLSRNDQRRLYDTECIFLPFWKFEEERYRKILRICLYDRIHADSTRLLFAGN